MESTGIVTIADFLAPGDFYQEPNREIYTSMLNLWRDKAPVSDASVCGDLTDRNKLDLAGGAAYVSSLSLDFPDIGNIDYYSKQVKNAATTRALRRLGKSLEHLPDGDPRDAVSTVLRQIIDLGADTMRSVPVQIGKTTAETTKKAMKLYGMSEADRAQALEKQSMKTGMIRFDSVTGGLKPSDLIIIGARPSIGKSALGLHLSRIFALKGNKVLFISLEMSSEQISRRLLAAESGVPYSRIEEGYMSGGQAARLVEANERLADIPLVVDDKAGQSVSDIRVKAMREQARGGVDLIVVDYLQKAAVDETSFADVTAVSNGLKALAKDLKIPVVALCQLSRSIENRDSRRPQLSDLKQSGAIEADADLVAFLWYPRLGSMDELEFDLQKHRNGGLGQVLLAFDKNRQQFEEIGGG